VKLFFIGFAGIMVGFIQTIQSFIMFGVIKMYPMMVTNLGIEIVWSIFAGICVCSAFYGKFILPETKGKSLDEILMSFESHKENIQNNCS